MLNNDMAGQWLTGVTPNAPGCRILIAAKYVQFWHIVIVSASGLMQSFCSSVEAAKSLAGMVGWDVPEGRRSPTTDSLNLGWEGNVCWDGQTLGRRKSTTPRERRVQTVACTSSQVGRSIQR